MLQRRLRFDAVHLSSTTMSITSSSFSCYIEQSSSYAHRSVSCPLIKQTIETGGLTTPFFSIHFNYSTCSIICSSCTTSQLQQFTIICARDVAVFSGITLYPTNIIVEHTRDYAQTLDSCLQSVIRIDFGDNNTKRRNKCWIRFEQ